MTRKNLYIVDTISTFRHRYVIEAKELEHAFDELTMVDSGVATDFFESAEQVYLGETILDGREITEAEFNNLLKDIETRRSGSHWLGQKLIHKLDYNE